MLKPVGGVVSLVRSKCGVVVQSVVRAGTARAVLLPGGCLRCRKIIPTCVTFHIPAQTTRMQEGEGLTPPPPFRPTLRPNRDTKLVVDSYRFCAHVHAHHIRVCILCTEDRAQCIDGPPSHAFTPISLSHRVSLPNGLAARHALMHMQWLSETSEILRAVVHVSQNEGAVLDGLVLCEARVPHLIVV